jgi:hypothetical protein
MKLNCTFLFSAILVMMMFMTSCQKDDIKNDPVPETELNFIISNNKEQLTKRITSRDELVPITPFESTRTKSSSVPPKDYTKNFAFKLKADVDAPEHNGKVLMATHVAIKDNYAFVSYNIRGPEYGGAVEVFDVTNLTSPQIISQAIFPEADINSVDYSDGKLFIVGALGNFEAFDYDDPAFFEVLTLNGQMQITGIEKIMDIPSYSANGIKVTNEKILITSGDQGGLTILDRNYINLSSAEIFDARSVDVNSDNIYVLSGQPGTISVFEKSSELAKDQWLIYGANTPYSKSEISVNDKYVFAALNEGGARMLKLDGTLKQHFQKPETPEGADDENHVTNSVVINHSLLFMGNGQSGIAVGEIIPELNDSVVVLGKMMFTDMQSSNFVQSKDSIVFVASGLGGLKILGIDIDNGIPDEIIPTEPCPTLLESIKLMFPESQNAQSLHPYLFQEDAGRNVITEQETNVYITFVWEGAGWKNTFGYYAYPVDNPPTSIAELEKMVVFPNVSMVGEGGGLEPGDMVQLGTGTFPANTVIGFYLVAQGWANGQLVDGVYTHYTDIEFNPHGIQQHLLFIENGCQDLVLTFEDIRLPQGDKDYNDIILVIKDNPDQLPNTRFNTEGIIVLGE